MTPDAQYRRIGWIVLLAILTGLYLTLHFKVQAVHSEVVRAERRIVSLEQEKLLLATEFETRANQMQLAAWNQVDFGYVAPTASQFLRGERQLAALGASAVRPGSSPVQLAEAPRNAVPLAALEAEVDAAPEVPGRVLAVADARAPAGEVQLAKASWSEVDGRVPMVALAGTASE